MKIVKWLFVLITSTVIIFCYIGLGVEANTRTGELQNVNINDGVYFKMNPTLGSGDHANQALWLQGPQKKLEPHWTIQRIEANNVVKGRLTTETTKIVVGLKGEITSNDSINHFPQFEFRKFTGALFYKKNDLWYSLGTPDNYSTWHSSLVNYTSEHSFSINIDKGLNNLGSLYPLKVGFSFYGEPIHGGNLMGPFFYELGEFIKPDALAGPTVDTPLEPQKLKITGTGVQGDKITSSVDEQITTTVKGNGTYELPVSNIKDYLKNHDSITVTQSDVYGGTGSTTINKLKLVPAQQNPEFYLEDVKQYTADNIIDDIVSQLNLKTGDAVDAKFDTDVDKVEVAKQINGLKIGESYDVPIHATKPGYIQSDDLMVRVTQSSGELAFDQAVTKLDFGLKKIPMNTEDYFPSTEFSIIVRDFRKKHTPWKITAKTVAQSSDNRYDLTQYLYYKDENNQDQSLKAGIDVYQKAADDSDNPTTEIRFGKDLKDEHNQPIPSRKVYVRAGPNMTVGKYHAAIIWTLENVPTGKA